MAKINFKKIQSRLGSAVGLVAGGVANSYAGNAIAKFDKNGKISPMVNAGIRIVAAAALPSIAGSNKKEGFINDFSNGMMAAAGIALAKALNMPGVSGTEIDDAVGYDSYGGGYMAGTSVSTPVAGVSN